MISAVLALFVTSISILFLSASIEPGLSELATSPSPIVHGLEQIFKLRDVDVSWFTLVPLYRVYFRIGTSDGFNGSIRLISIDLQTQHL